MAGRTGREIRQRWSNLAQPHQHEQDGAEREHGPPASRPLLVELAIAPGSASPWSWSRRRVQPRPQLFGQDLHRRGDARSWVRHGELDDGCRTDGLASSEEELRQLRRRVRMFEQEQEIVTLEHR